MSTEPGPVVDHRALGAALFNATWTWLETADRSPAQDDLMVHGAHASAYHWRQVGTPKNFARSEWLLARVYAVLNRAEPATQHARRCLELCTTHGIGEFDLAFAYEALARAAAVDGDHVAARTWVGHARAAADVITDPEDRDLLLADLATVPVDPAPR
jgi:hypothetical protein